MSIYTIPFSFSFPIHFKLQSSRHNFGAHSASGGRGRDRSQTESCCWDLFHAPPPLPLPTGRPFPSPSLRFHLGLPPPFPRASPTFFFPFPSFLPSLPSAPTLLNSLPRPHFHTLPCRALLYGCFISFIFSPCSCCQSPHFLVWLKCCLWPK